MEKLDPKIREHLHRDLDVTVERVRNFGRAGRATQLRVLAELRATVADQRTAIDIAVWALALSLLGVFITPFKGIDFEGMPWLASAIFAFLVGVFVVVVLLPAIGPQLLRNGRQQRARVWLAAYEDEIQRRRSRK